MFLAIKVFTNFCEYVGMFLVSTVFVRISVSMFLAITVLHISVSMWVCSLF